ncbi:MAG: MarR family transcriptional regulator [Clostridia bacterium]
MLEENFINVYTKFKLAFYKKIFARFENREATLTAVEIFCVEVIYALKKPTVQTFANFIGISSPNATYKINNLIKKGYVNKIQSKTDKREYHLEVSDKFLEYNGLTYDYTKTIVDRIEKRFTKEEVAQFNNFLKIISEELMCETNNLKGDDLNDK